MTDVRLLPSRFPRAGIRTVLPQSAALCYRIEQGLPEILLITTRRSGRWIIPKGWLIDGLSAAESAGQEAWEEAGAIGVCAQMPIGQFCYLKNRPKKSSALCQVEVFPMQVQSLAHDFPERGTRKRRWYAPEKAAAKINTPALAALLHEFGRLPHGLAAARA